MIPVRISPFFFLTAGFIGFINSRSFLGTLIWIGIIFFSVLIHEFGHALTARFFGQKPRIELVAFGGVTIPEGPRLTLWKEFVVIFNGPLFGFSLFIIATLLMQLQFSAPVMAFLNLFRIVNLFWTVINLIPVMPLDGGQLLRVVCEGVWGAKGVNYSLLGSTIVAAVGALIFFLLGWFLIGALFFIFAFQNFEGWRQTRLISADDQRDEHKSAMSSVEELISSGHREDAIPILEGLITKAKSGLIHDLATQHLAMICHEKGDEERAYFLLGPIKSELIPEALLILHHSAFEVGDYKMVLELAGECYQFTQTAEVATRSAIAAAECKREEAAIGWLEAALDHGLENFDEIVSRKSFDAMRSKRAFQALLDR